MSQPLASLRRRLEELLHSLESGRNPGRARLEETLTDGYAWALKLDAECARLERSIATLAAELDHGSSEQQAKNSPTPPGAWRAQAGSRRPQRAPGRASQRSGRSESRLDHSPLLTA